MLFDVDLKRQFMEMDGVKKEHDTSLPQEGESLIKASYDDFFAPRSNIEPEGWGDPSPSTDTNSQSDGPVDKLPPGVMKSMDLTSAFHFQGLSFVPGISHFDQDALLDDIVYDELSAQSTVVRPKKNGLVPVNVSTLMKMLICQCMKCLYFVG